MSLRPIEEKQPGSQDPVHSDPILDRVYRNRGVTSPDELEYDLKDLIPPSELTNVFDAADLLIKHIKAGSKIMIIGDYDCDGATSTTIAVEGLKLFGSKDVSYLIPDRMVHGYGLTPAIVEMAGEDKPDLIMTVDNGISSFAGAKAVRDLPFDCELLITDHHLPDQSMEVPDADVLINPNKPGCTFPSKGLAGCGVVFYLMMALRQRMDQTNTFEQLGIDKPKLHPMLDVLALGTVADVVPLDKNNRIIVSAGLKKINAGMVRPGMRHVLEMKKREIGKITSDDFGFALGPCVNAAGRLDNMAIGINCLLAEEDAVAQAFAATLVEKNESRKSITQDMEEDSLEIIEKENLNSDEVNGVCLYGEGWHEGVVGILAGRIKERLNRPTICFTQTHETSQIALLKQAIDQNNLQQAMDGIEELERLDSTSEAFALDLARCREGIVEDPKKALQLVGQLMHDYGEIKGSCRSIPGIHFRDVLDKIAKGRPELLSKFGGHAMAAGLTIKLDHFEPFCQYFNELISSEITEEIKIGCIMVDMMNPDPSLMSIDTAKSLTSGGPWGQHFESPVFASDFVVQDYRVLKEKHVKMTVSHPETDDAFTAIHFGCIDPGEEVPFEVGDKLQLVYTMDVNEFRGSESLQLKVDFAQNLTRELANRQKVEQTSEQQAGQTSKQDREPDDVLPGGIAQSQQSDQKKHLQSLVMG